MTTPDPTLLASLDATVVATMTAEVGHAWYRCERCGEFQLRRTGKAQGRCIMTSKCRGVVAVYLVRCCDGCGEPLSRRSRDGRYCRADCRPGGGA